MGLLIGFPVGNTESSQDPGTNELIVKRLVAQEREARGHEWHVARRSNGHGVWSGAPLHIDR